MDLKQLLALMQKRSGTKGDRVGRGIGVANSYFKASEIGADGCTLHEPWLLAGVTKDQWVSASKASEEKLVYRDDTMIVTGGIGKDLKSFGVAKRKDASSLTTGSCMDFEGVATSRAKDRDGDIIEPSGAEFDPNQPLLLHHNPTLPVGKMIGVVSQDASEVSCHWSMIDLLIGQDAARLVEFGAFRLSIGFIPKEYKFIGEDSEGYVEDERNGVHIYKLYVMETSLVTVPANTDAIITQFSREKLLSDYMKAWAKTFSDARPTVVKTGYDPATGAPNVNVTVNITTKDESPKDKPKDDDKPSPKDDEKPKEDDEPKEPAGKNNENPAIADIENAVGKLSEMDLPQEAKDRLNVIANMLAPLKESAETFAATVGQAAKDGDIAAVQEATNAHAANYSGCLSRMSQEMETICGIDGLSDEAVSAIGDARDLIDMVSSAISAMSSKDDEIDLDDEKSDDDMDIDLPDDDKDEDQIITSEPAYGGEISADNDGIPGWDGDKAMSEIASQLIGGFMQGKQIDSETLLMLKDAVDDRLAEVAEQEIEAALA